MLTCVKTSYLEVLDKNGTLVFVPNGNSMWPFLKHRHQTVIIQKISTTVNKFDVIFFRRENGDFVLHRVIDVDGDTFTVRGDSQLFTESVKKDHVFGIMTGFYKGKNFVCANDKKYLQKVEKWYKNGFFTRLKIKAFYGKLKLKHIAVKMVKGA